ncbi:hypothetical protein TI04_05070 [Achromatium sp. WMS2]|nr:hypothetical protein TI04_05070 [Achromatium sp. WMS2]
MESRNLSRYFLILFIVLCNITWVGAEETTILDEVVVTAPRMEEALTVTNNPKAPQQPVPANDGAALLRNIPGFSMIRKGGTDGDPVLRGLAGSRLNLLIDGAELLGGCGMRMDPPTAYVFPEVYDRVTVLKGPQTVRYGNGNLAGVVLFDRDINQLRQPGIRGNGSLMVGSWGRVDGVVSSNIGSELGFLQATISHAEADDYRDGDGRRVHSSYNRESVTGVVGWTPDNDTKITLDAIGSRAKAAYADRGMDGAKFDRQGIGLKAERENVSPLIKKVSGHVYYNYIDHVMDNYSQRTLAVGSMPMVSNPDRETEGARVSAELGLSTATLLTIGFDWQSNKHTLRKGGVNYASLPRIRDMETSMWGAYGELRYDLSFSSRLLGGLRYDYWSANRYSSTNGATMASDNAGLMAGFLRYEQDLQELPVTIYVGLGHAERPMDYWEASTYNGLVATSKIDPERNTQLDLGVLWDTDTLSASASLFYSKMNDYILITPGASTAVRVRNVDATRWGGELDGAWRFMPDWTLRGSLAYTWGQNDSMDVALAQTPPLEAKLGLDYKTGPWTVAGLLRMVSDQDRVHVGYGNIVGTDLGKSSGFATLALNASYRPSKNWLVSVGVDNIFDQPYAEHISRNGVDITGFEQTTRVNEPGRFMWLKVTAEY